MSTPAPQSSVAVVIPTYERPDQLRVTVESVCEQTLEDYEVIVVDDGSALEEQLTALEDVESSHERVRVLRQENAGPAAARNRGWRATDAAVVAFTDDDCLVPETWLESLLDSFEPGVGAVGGPLVPPETAVERSVFARLHVHRLQEVYEIPDEPTVGGDDLPMGGTANIAYLREALTAVEGFDETFPTAAGEDADIQTRVVASGYAMKFVPIEVVHNDTYDWQSFKSRTIRHGTGAYYFARRHGTPRPAWRVVAGLIAAPLFLGSEFLRSGDITVSALAIMERMFARIGELKAIQSSE